jgi:hypothetical protein
MMRCVSSAVASSNFWGFVLNGYAAPTGVSEKKFFMPTQNFLPCTAAQEKCSRVSFLFLNLLVYIFVSSIGCLQQ